MNYGQQIRPLQSYDAWVTSTVKRQDIREINNALNTWQNDTLCPLRKGLANDPECIKESRLPPKSNYFIPGPCQTLPKTLIIIFCDILDNVSTQTQNAVKI